MHGRRARWCELLPFSHVQFAADSRFARVSVISGDARVAAYVSQVNAIGDAMFIPAERLRPETVRARIAPADQRRSVWRTDLWLSADDAAHRCSSRSAGRRRGSVDDVSMCFANVHRGARTSWPDRGSRDTHRYGRQFVPFVEATVGDEQQLLFIETAPPYRTNIGIVVASST